MPLAVGKPHSSDWIFRWLCGRRESASGCIDARSPVAWPKAEFFDEQMTIQMRVRGPSRGCWIVRGARWAHATAEPSNSQAQLYSMTLATAGHAMSFSRL